MKKGLTEKEFEERFDAGDDPRPLGFDLDNGVIDQPETKCVNIDLPPAMLRRLDYEARNHSAIIDQGLVVRTIRGGKEIAFD